MFYLFIGANYEFFYRGYQNKAIKVSLEDAFRAE